MARIKNPLLLSKHFGIDEQKLIDAGLVDPFLNVDTQLFIDPVLLSKCSDCEISQHAYGHFKTHFGNYIRLLAISRREGDAAWRAARALLDLREPPHTGLGYGGSSRRGSSRPLSIREAIMRTSKEIIELGSNDPDMICLMGFFEENVGPDTISDYTTRVIMNSLGKITARFCLQNDIPLSDTHGVCDVALPTYKGAPIILVPMEIVRDLPIANDWSEIQAAALQNAHIRDGVNQFLGRIARPTIADRKSALRTVALQSAELFGEFLNSVRDNASSYDPNTDRLAYYKLREILSSNPDQFRVQGVPDIKSGAEALREFVLHTIRHFQHHVENGNLWEALWDGDSPKKERAAQLIYFAIADIFCEANNVDISPEANMGGGPVDFKFSHGYNARVLVELKRSDGAVRHGYERQLEIYKDASRTNFGIFVVLDYGDFREKLRQIQSIQRQIRGRGDRASDIIVIDATKKKSASKRR